MDTLRRRPRASSSQRMTSKSSGQSAPAMLKHAAASPPQSRPAPLPASAPAMAGALAGSGAGRDWGGLAAACFSMAGADWPEDFEVIRCELEARGLRRNVSIYNDAIGALRAGTVDGY